MKFSVAILLSASSVLAAPAPVPAPPGVPSESTARSLLSGLTVGPPTNVNTYDRDLFPHWEPVEGACNTRETVLKRDGQNVKTNSACAATSGTWLSPFDGATWTQASDVDIDHMVPLQNAWISGAASWTTSKRRDFANDLVRPQLYAVTDNVNQEKGSDTPATWKPPLKSFYCTYAKSWIQVKSYWDLAITGAEKSALAEMLNSC
ncbi:hypothetical protein FZEAL_1738 [Fusarium zealandicum]|uniref:GmrSD restriction endonucleases C-terminal domain-containing protein n=1 Tax=Fusarium zealandicum TaxID=1053134 RepID=A0A8H4XP42_9HYPO|nr:hypothetical protein FZEAL_1738 [Fusarium zealandicum]